MLSLDRINTCWTHLFVFAMGVFVGCTLCTLVTMYATKSLAKSLALE